MNIPNFINEQMVDENGYLTDTWRQVLSELFTQLQLNLSDESIIVPQQTTAKIAQLSTTDYEGGLLYDSDTDQLKVNLAGTFKVVQTI